MRPRIDATAATVVARIAQARTQLALAGLNDAAAGFDAEVLARTALGWSRADLLANGREPEPPGFADIYAGLIARRAAREPVAYITGRREFWGLEFEVTPAVLIPRPETELLVEQVVARQRAGLACCRIVDVGTGSGCIAAAVARALPDAQIVAVDRSPDALAVAARNFGRLVPGGRVTPVVGDLLTAFRGPFDVVVSNPPYVPLPAAPALQPEVARHEPAAALYAGEDGLDVVRRLCRTAGSLLAPDGALMMEIGAGQAPAVADAARAAGWRGVRFVDDLAGIARTVVLTEPCAIPCGVAAAPVEVL